MTKVAISGFTASGKTTAASLLAERLGAKHICPSFKEWAKEAGVSLLEFQKEAEIKPEIDWKFDEYVKDLLSQEEDAVVSTWLGPWLLPVDFRVFLFCPFRERVKRVMQREHLNEKEAERYINMKDSSNFRRYKRLYNLDLEDMENFTVFDLTLNSAVYSPEEIVDLILEGIEKKRR